MMAGVPGMVPAKRTLSSGGSEGGVSAPGFAGPPASQIK